LGELAIGFGLLSDATRVGILKALASGPKNVAALCKAVGARRPTISHHVGLLKLGGLVRSTHKGRSVMYTADKARIGALAAVLARMTTRK